MIAASVRERLRELVGEGRVLTSPVDLETYGYDGTALLRQRPDAVVFVRSTEEVSALLRLANEVRFPVVPRGSGTGLSGGSIPVAGSVVMVTLQQDRILEIDEGNLTARVEPGVITSRLHEAVEAQGLFYPPDPGSMRVCTLGGNVAENAGGLRGLKYGVTRDYVLGLEIVLPTGEILRTGGKSVKDVAGYRLKDLFIGSEGTLGVFTEILLKLVPRPAATRTLLAVYDCFLDAARSVSEIIAAKIIPCTLEFVDQTTLRCVEEYARVGLPVDAAAVLLVEVDGHPAVVAEEAEAVTSVCRREGARSVRLAADAQEAMQLATARRTAFSALARVSPTTILEDATVPRSEVAPMLEFIQQTAARHGLRIGTFGHAGDGNLHPTFLTDERDSAQLDRVHRAFDEIFTRALELGGTITGEHGIGLAKRDFLPHAAGEVGMEVTRKVKAALDPNGILNPGKVLSVAPHCETLVV